MSPPSQCSEEWRKVLKWSKEKRSWRSCATVDATGSIQALIGEMYQMKVVNMFTFISVFFVRRISLCICLCWRRDISVFDLQVWKLLSMYGKRLFVSFSFLFFPPTLESYQRFKIHYFLVRVTVDTMLLVRGSRKKKRKKKDGKK